MKAHTLYDLVWMEHWNSTRYVNSGWAREVEKYWQKHLCPYFGDMDLSEITPLVVKRFHNSLRETPVTANRCLEVLSRMFRHAQENEIVAQGVNPCALVRAYPEKKRTRFATEEEIKRIMAALEKHSKHYPVLSAFVILLLYTGSRPSALMRARRGDIRKVVDILALEFNGKSTAKTGIDETVIVPSAVTHIIDNLPSRIDGFLFGKLNYNAFWKMIAKEAGCPDLWLRDLRRTYATVGFSSGVDLKVVGELLNHSSIQTTKTYAKLLINARVNASNVIANRLHYLSSN